jgi:hypothetical protein
MLDNKSIDKEVANYHLLLYSTINQLYSVKIERDLSPLEPLSLPHEYLPLFVILIVLKII